MHGELAIGLQDVDGLKTSSYLYETAKKNIEGEISVEEAGTLIDSYYKSKDCRLESGKRLILINNSGWLVRAIRLLYGTMNLKTPNYPPHPRSHFLNKLDKFALILRRNEIHFIFCKVFHKN